MYQTIISLVLFIILTGCEGQFLTTHKELRAAEDAYDRELLRASPIEIEAWHVRNETGLLDSLRDGVKVSSIVDDFKSTNCELTEEMKELWSWRNGETGSVPLVWYHDFLSLDEAMAEYNSLTRHPLISWDPNFIPLFTFEGEWYAGYCSRGKSNAGPVVLYSLEDEPRVAYINITTFLASMAEAMRTGAVTWKEGSMIEDIHEVRRIHKKYNPDYPFPYYVPD